MGAIFISYRRNDTEGQAGRLFEALRDAFGTDMVFMDVATIEPGVDFRKVIDRNTANCGVLLALIGRDWLSMVDEAGGRRLDNPNDFVRLETASALRRDIPVIPVLVQGARMPRAEELPEDLRELAFRNSVELTHARWESDVQLLVKALRPHAEASPAPPPKPTAGPALRDPRPRPWLWPVVGAAALAAGVGVWSRFGTRLPEPVPASQPTLEAAQSVTPPASTPSGTGKLAPDLPAADNAAEDNAAREKAARAKIAREKAERDRQARERAEQERQTRQRAAEDERQAQAVAEQQQQQQQQALLLAEKERQDVRAAQTRAHNEGLCVSGYVWRDARSGDKVCVTPAVRSRSAAENAAAAQTRQPGGGPYGPNTCRQGFVWRDAFTGDQVCVPPASRDAAAADNAAARARVVPPPA